MENLPRDLEKDVAPFVHPKPSKRSEGWTLFFVGSYGKTRQIRWFKGLIFIWGFLLIAAIASAGCFYLLYKNEMEKNRRLEMALKKGAVASDGEKKRLAARSKPGADSGEAVELKPAIPKPPAKPLSREKLEKKAEPEKKSKPEKRDIEPEKEAALSEKKAVEPVKKNAEPEQKDAETGKKGFKTERKDTKPEKKAAEPEKKVAEPEKKAADPEKKDAEKRHKAADAKKAESNVSSPDKHAEKTQPSPSDQSPRIRLEDFKVTYIKRRRILNMQIRIRNTDSKRISGHAVVVLKPNKRKRRGWLSVPRVRLISGKPSGKEIGNPFSISNFKILKFSAKKQRYPKWYKIATVFVFGEAGDLLLKEDFPVEIE